MNWTVSEMEEIEMLLQEFKSLHPHSQGGRTRPEHWENEFQVRHRFDTVIKINLNGAMVPTDKYEYKPIRRI